jgi:hypothetical protein
MAGLTKHKTKPNSRNMAFNTCKDIKAHCISQQNYMKMN